MFTFKYLHVDICSGYGYLQWISRFYLGYLHAINHSSAASHRSIAQTRKITAIRVKVFTIV